MQTQTDIHFEFNVLQRRDRILGDQQSKGLVDSRH
jgi:hypothetical protein